MAGYDFINRFLIDFIVSSIQKSHKRELSSFTMIKPRLIFVRVVMLMHMF